MRPALSLLVLLTLFRVEGSIPAALGLQHPDTTHTKKKEITVYITRRGSTYHRDSCRYLNKSKIALPISEAKKFYRPCKICKPAE